MMSDNAATNILEAQFCLRKKYFSVECIQKRMCDVNRLFILRIVNQISVLLLREIKQRNMVRILN
jgi:hypothetical protein